MSAARGERFLFGQDFGRSADPEGIDRVVHDAAVAQSFADGVAAGRLEAAADTERAVAAALDAIGAGLANGRDRMEAASAAIERDALLFFEALARTLAAEALAEKPLAAIAAASLGAFRHLRGVPHLAVRVEPSLVDPVHALMGRLARERGYDGRVIVLGDEALPPGDARIEWADGGVVLDRAAVDAAVAAVLAADLPMESRS